MAWEELARDADRENSKSRDRLVGVYIGILAVILAICSLGGSNANQDSTEQYIAASNVWAFFQAKNARRQALRLHTDEFEMMLKTAPTMPDAVKKSIEAKIADYREQDKKNSPAIPKAANASTSFSIKARRSRPSATEPSSKGRISITAKPCCRSPSFWRPLPSYRAVICCCSEVSFSERSVPSQPSAGSRWRFHCPLRADAHLRSMLARLAAITPPSRKSCTRPS